MASRRLSVDQMLRAVEGAELLSSASGLSISEILTVVFGEPAVQREEEDADDVAEPRPRLAAGDR